MKKIDSESLKRGRRGSLEIPEPRVKTNHFTIGKSPKTTGITNVLTGRPKRTSQQGVLNSKNFQLRITVLSNPAKNCPIDIPNNSCLQVQ